MKPMTSRERVRNALEFKEVDRIPIENYHEGINELYASDVWSPTFKYGKGQRSGVVNRKGSWVDEWGCVWVAAEEDVKGEVKHSPLNDWAAFDRFQPPWDVLDEADLSMVDRQCHESDKFMISFWDTAASPFQRMQFLRGTENLFLDLAYGDVNVYKLRDMVHEYLMRQLNMWVRTAVDGIHIEDDWGAQHSLLISPKLWREFYKPLYKDYCDLAHSYRKYVLMHSDGYIMEIIPDLIEIGVDAVNPQLFCMDIEELAKLYHHKIAFWGEIDRQYLLPFGTEAEVRAGVRRVANAFLPYGRTGIVGQCSWGKDMKRENILAAYDEWSKV